MSAPRTRAAAPEAGRELDAMVAERVMGGEPISRKCLANYDDQKLPHYSTDIAAAWTVVDAVDTRNAAARAVGVRTFSIHRYDDGTYIASFFNASATANPAPLAICLAALQAVSASPEAGPSR